MIITCENSKIVDTALLSPEERHIIQKLLAWQSLAQSVSFFREKTAAALAAGWNASGPIPKTRALEQVIYHLETKLSQRLDKTPL